MMNRCNRLIVDCTDLVHFGGNTGIQRTERNLINHLEPLCNDAQIPFKLAVFDRAYGFVEISTLQNASESIGYFRSVASAAREPWRARRLLNALFPQAGTNSPLDALWKTWWRFPVTFLALTAMSPAIVAALLMAKYQRGQLKIRPNDVFAILGSSWWVVDGYGHAIDKLKSKGARLVPLIYDTIPITHPICVGPQSAQTFSLQITRVLRESEIILTISRDAAASINEFASRDTKFDTPVLPIRLGFELDLLEEGSSIRSSLLALFDGSAPVFISVGTIEPRKNYDFLIDTFEIIWKTCPNIRLAIIGKYGWRAEALRSRLLDNAEIYPNLIWFDDLTDTELEYAYRKANSLVFPSLAEGFGLPIVEALSCGCQVLASDIEVFHEIGGKYCAYFSIEDYSELVELVNQITKFGCVPDIPHLSDFTWPSWHECANEVITILKPLLLPDNTECTSETNLRHKM
jgi:glycosyltransferase involved in cell wall biosynthesis